MQAVAGGKPGPDVIARGGNNTWATYQIESARTGTALELAVQGTPVGGFRGRGGRGGRGEAVPTEVIARQEAAQVSAGWPSSPIDLRLAPYMAQAQQAWTMTPVATAGGYPGSPYVRFTIAGTDRALAATADRELVAYPPSPGRPSNSGASTNSPMARIASCRRRSRMRKNHWPFQPLAAACRRSTGSAPAAIVNAGCSRHHEATTQCSHAPIDRPHHPRQLRGLPRRRCAEQPRTRSSATRRRFPPALARARTRAHGARAIEHASR